MDFLVALVLSWIPPEPGALPPLTDLYRFPNEDGTDDARAWRIEVDEYLACRLAVGSADRRAVLVAIDAGKKAWQPWCLLIMARSDCGDYTILERRQSLDELRALIGQRAYAEGRMPCPVAWRTFPERD